MEADWNVCSDRWRPTTSARKWLDWLAEVFLQQFHEPGRLDWAGNSGSMVERDVEMTYGVNQIWMTEAGKTDGSGRRKRNLNKDAVENIVPKPNMIDALSFICRSWVTEARDEKWSTCRQPGLPSKNNRIILDQRSKQTWSFFYSRWRQLFVNWVRNGPVGNIKSIHVIVFGRYSQN